MNIKLAIPNRGRLAELCCDIVNSSYNLKIRLEDRIMSYTTVNDDIETEILLLRSTEIPKLLESNDVNIGITGNDYFLDSGANIIEGNNLFLFNGLLCILSSQYGVIGCYSDLLNSSNLRCYSQYKNISKQFFEKINSSINVTGIDGAAETYFGLNLCDLVIDVVTTGSTFAKNQLKVLFPIMPVSTHIYINNEFSNKYSELCRSTIYKICGQHMQLLNKEDSNTYTTYNKAIEIFKDNNKRSCL